MVLREFVDGLYIIKTLNNHPWNFREILSGYLFLLFFFFNEKGVRSFYQFFQWAHDFKKVRNTIVPYPTSSLNHHCNILLRISQPLFEYLQRQKAYYLRRQPTLPLVRSINNNNINIHRFCLPIIYLRCHSIYTNHIQ